MKFFERFFGKDKCVDEEINVEIEEENEEEIEEEIEGVFTCSKCGEEYPEDEQDYDSGLCYSCIEVLREKYFNEYKTCPDCNGTGFAYIGKQCETCGGQGDI